MTTINISSILSKVDTLMDSSKGANVVSDAVDKSVVKSMSSVATLAAQDFISVLQDEVRSLGSISRNGSLGTTGISALTKLSYGRPRKVLGGNAYEIDIYFTENLRRDSLSVDRYEDLNNLAALINNGYSAKNKTYGVWLGHNNNDSIVSRQSRPATKFIQEAMRAFKEKYSTKYKIIDIDCDSVYKE